DHLARLKLPMHMTRTARAFLSSLADGLGGPQAVGLRALMSAGSQVGSALIDHAVRDPGLAAELRAITHNTVTPTGLRAGVKINVIPTTAEATLDCRTVPGVDSAELLRELQEALGDEARRLTFEVDSAASGLEFDFDTPLFHVIGETLKRHDPAGIPVPFMLTGGTDAKHVAKLGTICYGFSPMRFAPGERFSELVHGHNERVAVDSLGWGVRVLYEVVSEFCCAAPRP
ncbi:MAG: M20/M25/M40 family metallo-hydrolase, partial [Anaerolineae bacterium]|nr:M20/M25/M40 family metallo-hydrolase [Thermoflexales bacterium]MDW8408984.1 M20/M25/M40 family metallo-hydrolase [Anaerolineae bacterium]